MLDAIFSDIRDYLVLFCLYWRIGVPAALLLSAIFILPLCLALFQASRMARAESQRSTPQGPRVFFGKVFWRRIRKWAPVWAISHIVLASLGYLVGSRAPLAPNASQELLDRLLKHRFCFVADENQELSIPSAIFIPLTIISYQLVLTATAFLLARRQMRPGCFLLFTVFSSLLIFTLASVPCWYSAGSIYLQWMPLRLSPWYPPAGFNLLFGLWYPLKVFFLSILFALSLALWTRRLRYRWPHRA